MSDENLFQEKNDGQNCFIDKTFEDLIGKFDQKQFQTLHETMSFEQYVKRVIENPRLVRGAYQRMYDMIMREGTTQFKRYRKTYTHYNFFDNGEVPIYGLDDTLQELVRFIRGAAGGYGTERRFLLLHGPVGSSKSTICSRLKKGLEEYSRSDDGVWYTYRWKNLPTGADGIFINDTDLCPMNDSPLKLIPQNVRNSFMDELNARLLESVPEKERNSTYTLKCVGDLNPRCNKFMEELLIRYKGDWRKVVTEHIEVVRIVHSESSRCGIATFQPKDEKNQDATELTGDINYALLPHFGSDSDPRAFNFDGEFCVGNGGMVEFIEVLKLAKEFLYDLLGASQERKIKPKKFPQISVDTVLIGHTNNPEYEKLKSDQTMEALRDRTYKIDVPYLLRWKDEIKVLEMDFGPSKVKQHVAPHTIEIAALWAVITRLQNEKEGKLTLVEKAKLYNDQPIEGQTQDSVKELKDKYPDEGMYGGVSARYVQDKISNCLADNHDYINPFMVLNEIRKGLDNSALITNKEEADKYIACVDMAKKELSEILKYEVRKAMVGDDEAAVRLCTNYIDNVRAYIDKSKVKNPYTGEDQAPNESLMRSIEEKIDVPEPQADNFRRELASFIGKLAMEGKVFSWESNTQLQKAIEAKLFDDLKDHIKVSSISMHGDSVVDKNLQEKIDAIKTRLIKQYKYTEQSATDVLNYVGSIFARGDLEGDD